MAERTLNTRIKLRYASYSEWQSSTVQLLPGEVAVCYVEANNSEILNTAPTVLFKVGDGSHTFKDLKWSSARAADVFDWAKVSGENVFTKIGNGNVISNIEWDSTLNDNKGGFKFSTASVATSEGLEGLQDKVADLETSVQGLVETSIPAIEATLAKKAEQSELERVEGLFDNYTTTENLNGLLEAKANKTYVDEELGKKANSADVYSKTEADETFLKSHQDISGKADITYVDGEIDKVEESINEVDGKFAGYYTKTEVDNKGYLVAADIANKAEQSAVDAALALKADKTYVDDEIDKVEELINAKADSSALDNYYTKGEVYNKTEIDGIVATITDGVDAEKVDGLNDLIDWVDTHGAEVSAIKKDIEDNASAIEGLDGRLGTVETAVGTVDERIAAAESRVDAKLAKKVDAVEGSSLMTQAEHEKLAGLENYDDTELTNKVQAIEDDYLKAADKEELNNAINTEKGRVDTLVNTTIPGIDNRVKALEEKPFDTYATKSEVEAVDGKVGGVDERLAAVEADYLKAADKEELQGEISSAVKAEKDRAEAAELALSNRVKNVEDNYLSSTDVIIWDCGGAN